MAHLFKSRLQNFAQKRNIAFPTYTCEMEGPPHCPLFRAHVTIDGNTYVGPEFCTTLKDAEHAAAKVAVMSLSPEGEQQDDCLYKSLLQELAQKKRLLLPIYTTVRTGPPHVPCFASSVHIADDCYVGENARTKKQAEMNAAKVAYLALSTGGPRTNNTAAVSNIQTVGASSSGSPILQTAVTHIDEPIIIPPASKIQTTINDQALSIANEAEKGKGYQDLKNFQVVIEKHKNTMAPPVIHQSQPKATPDVDFAKLSIRQEDVVTHTTEGSSAHWKINQLSSTANEMTNQLSSTANERINQLSSTANEKINQLSSTANERINQLSSTANERINQLSSTANEKINQLSSTANERINQLSSTANEKINQLSPTEVTSDPVVGLDALRPHSTKIVIRPHVKGMTYDGAVQVSDEDWVAMKVIVYEET